MADVSLPPAPPTRTLQDTWDDPSLLADPPYALFRVLVRGAVHILFALPKVGKTQFLAHLAVAMAAGLREFAGRTITPGAILWVDCEQGQRTTLRSLRLASEAVNGGRKPPHPIHVLDGQGVTATQLAALVHEIRPVLVVIDTIGRYYASRGLEDHNSTGEWLKLLGPDVAIFHALGEGDLSCAPAWVFIDHARKSGGDHGQALNGSVAKQGAVDVLVEMRRGRTETQRVLELTSRFDGVRTVGLDLVEGGTYQEADVAAPVKVRHGQDAAVMLALSDAPGPLTRKQLQEATGIPEASVRRICVRLVESGEIALVEDAGRGKAARYTLRDDAPGLALAPPLPDAA
ncbi:MAG: AAA family ATPase [Gemmatimonadaceae bacterium]|jgi:hypothetical protein|nr:AAA family ATPase [Gemmatimonadaceae bacterium]